jgi:hypothetical protein
MLSPLACWLPGADVAIVLQPAGTGIFAMPSVLSADAGDHWVWPATVNLVRTSPGEGLDPGTDPRLLAADHNRPVGFQVANVGSPLVVDVVHDLYKPYRVGQ